MKRFFLVLFVLLCLGATEGSLAARSGREEFSYSEMSSGDSAERISRCATQVREEQQRSPNTDILFVLDASSSLRKRRNDGPLAWDVSFSALQNVVDTLASLKSGTSEQGRGRTRFQFLQFGSSVQPLFTSSDEWIDVKDEFTLEDGRAVQNDTDYVSALLGAIRALKSSDADCKVVLWFTDGQFDISDTLKERRRFQWLEDAGLPAEVLGVQQSNRAENVGVEILCGSGYGVSLADQVRQISGSRENGLTLIGLALGAGGSFDDGLLRRIVLNEDGDCGSLEPVGTVVSVGEASDLAFQMREALIGGKTIESTCDEEQKAQGVNTLNLWDAIELVDIFVRVNRNSTNRVYLLRDDGARVELWDGRPKNGRKHGIVFETRLTADKSSRATFNSKLSFESSNRDWRGSWTLQICGRSGGASPDALANIVARGCVDLVLAEDSKQLIAGRSKFLRLTTARCVGGPDRDFSNNQHIELQTTLLLDGKRFERRLDSGFVTIPYEATLSGGDSQGSESRRFIEVKNLRATYRIFGDEEVELDVPTGSSTLDFVVRRPPRTPIIEFSNREACTPIKKGDKSRRSVCQIRILGDPREDGSVSIGSTEVDSTDAIGEIKTSIRDSSGEALSGDLRVPAGASKELIAEFVLETPQRNTSLEVVEGEISATSSNSTQKDPVILPVRFRVEPDFESRPNWARAIISVLVLLLGAGCVLLAIKVFGLRLFVGSSGRGLFINKFHLESLESKEFSEAFSRTPESRPITAVASEGHVSELTPSDIPLGDGLRIKAVNSLNPLRMTGFARLSHPSRVVIGPDGFDTHRGSGRGPLMLPSLWCAVTDKPRTGSGSSTSSDPEAQLRRQPWDVFVISSGPLGPEALKTLRTRIQNRLDSHVGANSRAIFGETASSPKESAAPVPPALAGETKDGRVRKEPPKL